MSICSCGPDDACDRCNQRLTDMEYRALLDLMMVSDPWPLTSGKNTTLVALLREEADARGYESWTVAYHEHEVNSV